MKVLVLPYNIASMSVITAGALNKIEGVHAKCLTIEVHKYQMVDSDTICLPIVAMHNQIFLLLAAVIKQICLLLVAVLNRICQELLMTSNKLFVMWSRIQWRIVI